MAAVKSLGQLLIDAIVKHIAEHPSIPPKNRAAFYEVAPRLVQESIRSVIGCDSVRLTGWLILPAERMGRRERILSALHAGEAPAAIASREVVSRRWVEKLRKGIGDGLRTGKP